MNMKHNLSFVGPLIFAALLVAGCASTSIEHVSGDEFQKLAQGCTIMNSFSWISYVGCSESRAYLEYGYPAAIGHGARTTVYWTDLSELSTNLATQLKAGTPPWTNWTMPNLEQLKRGGWRAVP